MSTASAPSLEGFKVWIGYQRVPVEALPLTDPVIPMAYNVALTLTNQWFINVPSPDPSLPSIYALMVYNLAMDRVANFASDPEESPLYPGTDLPYWEGFRQKANLYGFVGGVITSAGDNGTSQGMQAPKVMESLTFDDLQTLKTRWGRQYLSFANMFGDDWGIS